MDYIKLKSNSRLEYRLYLEKPEDENLDIIYQGHKLGINDSFLDQILDYRFEVSTNRIYYLKYDIWLNKFSNELPNLTNLEIWKSGRDSKDKELYDIWENLLQFIRNKLGTFKNIWIVKVNI